MIRIEATQNAPKMPRSRICGIEVTRMTSSPQTSVMMPSVPGTTSSPIATVATSIFACCGSPMTGSIVS